MPANRDKNQKFTFVYSNLYRIYQDTKPSTQPVESVGAKAPIRRGPPVTSGKVLKAENLKAGGAAAVEVRSFTPATLRAPESMAPNSALDSLKKNLEQLNDLHQRLKFMLSELEELAKE